MYQLNEVAYTSDIYDRVTFLCKKTTNDTNQENLCSGMGAENQ